MNEIKEIQSHFQEFNKRRVEIILEEIKDGPKQQTFESQQESIIDNYKNTKKFKVKLSGVRVRSPRKDNLSEVRCLSLEPLLLPQEEQKQTSFRSAQENSLKDKKMIDIESDQNRKNNGDSIPFIEKSQKFMRQVLDIITLNAFTSQNTEDQRDSVQSSPVYQGNLQMKILEFQNMEEIPLPALNKLRISQQLESQKLKEQLRRKSQKIHHLQEKYEQIYGIDTVKVEFLINYNNSNLILSNQLQRSLPHYETIPDQKELIKTDVAISNKDGKQIYFIAGKLYKLMKNHYLDIISGKNAKVEFDYRMEVKDYHQYIRVCMKHCKKTQELQCFFHSIRHLDNNSERHSLQESRRAFRRHSKIQYGSLLTVDEPRTLINIISKFKGTQIQCDTKAEWFERNDQIISDRDALKTLCEGKFQSKLKNEDQIIWLQYNDKKEIAAFEFGKNPYLIDQASQQKIQIKKKGSHKIYWDYFRTFTPESQIAIDNCQPYHLEKIEPHSIEYKYIAFKFGETFKQRDSNLFSIKESFKQLASIGLSIDSYKIIQIEKVYYSDQYMRFSKQLWFDMVSYSLEADKALTHLFMKPSSGQNKIPLLDPKDTPHHSNDSPLQLFDSAFAVNQRLDKNSDDSSEIKQMICCLALIGRENIKNHDRDYIERDSIWENKPQCDLKYNGKQGKYIVYNKSRIYPGYLISYRT